LFVPCGGLSWLPVSFLLHVKYTLSYCIVFSFFTGRATYVTYHNYCTPFRSSERKYLSERVQLSKLKFQPLPILACISATIHTDVSLCQEHTYQKLAPKRYHKPAWK